MSTVGLEFPQVCYECTYHTADSKLCKIGTSVCRLDVCIEDPLVGNPNFAVRTTEYRKKLKGIQKLCQAKLIPESEKLMERLSYTEEEYLQLVQNLN